MEKGEGNEDKQSLDENVKEQPEQGEISEGEKAPKIVLLKTGESIATSLNTPLLYNPATNVRIVAVMGLPRAHPRDYTKRVAVGYRPTETGNIDDGASGEFFLASLDNNDSQTYQMLVGEKVARVIFGRGLITGERETTTFGPYESFEYPHSLGEDLMKGVGIFVARHHFELQFQPPQLVITDLSRHHTQVTSQQPIN